MDRRLRFEHALLPGGAFARDVLVVVRDGIVAEVVPDAPPDDAETVAGIAVPGLPNLHSHAFQRGMAGLAERRGPEGDSFWTWREVMYRFVGALSPDDVEAIAALAYAEMLERGFTSVAEFHYLHHGRDGGLYDDPAEMAGRIAAAAAETGIGLTLLPVFYAQGGFGGLPPNAGQRRFVTDPDGFARLVEASRRHLAPLPGARLGIAPHSLRAVTPDSLRAVVAAAPDGPIHIHVAEQMREVEDSLAWSGRRPVAWLLDEMPVDARWCAIHATHMDSVETARLSASGAVAGLCPLTEASLGDGLFDGPAFLGAGGRFGIGSDSNVEIDAPGELRMLEYGQRLGRRGRNLMTVREGESTGARLFAEALAGGAQALGRAPAAVAPGSRADIVVLDADHPAFAAAGPDAWLDAWIFSGGREVVENVIVAGDTLVVGGRHRRRDTIVARYRGAMARLRDM